jgi:hypothetical protein
LHPLKRIVKLFKHIILLIHTPVYLVFI